MKYSIWIIPPEPVFGLLKKIIADLAEQYGGPVFTPHMTLLGSINTDLKTVKESVEKLVKYAGHLQLFLGPVSFSTTYFQSVFVRVNSTAKLMELNLGIKKLLNIENNVFMPHISLVYGNHVMKTREKIASSLNLRPTSFLVKQIVIIPEKPDPNKWTPVTTIHFKS